MSKPEALDDVVISKWVGMNATATIIKEHYKELRGRYSEMFLEEGLDLATLLSVSKEIQFGQSEFCHGYVEAGFGGIYGALFQLGYEADLGFRIDLHKIPIQSSTIEIAEFYHLNPYLLYSKGTVAFAVPHGDLAVEQLNQMGIEANVVGHMTKEKGRIVYLNEEEKYLTPARRDEVFLCMDREKYESNFPKVKPILCS